MPEFRYRRLWLPELLTLTLLIVAALFLFRDSSLDLWAAKLFYHPENSADVWFEQNNWLWDFFYKGAPWITGTLLLGSLVTLLIAQIKQKYKHLRKYAIFIFLTIGLGSGLMINAVFKPYWGRPRPREIIELGGKQTYQLACVPRFGESGKSFPCGHCSVGFTFGVFWWIFRRKNLKLAILGLASSAGLGTLMTIGRISAGGHFLSDGVWAGIISLGTGFLLYYFVLNIPKQEDAEAGSEAKSFFEQKKSLAYGLYFTLGLFTIAGLLLASPFYQDVNLSAPEGESFTVSLANTSVEVNTDESIELPMKLVGTIRGFGFPKNTVEQYCKSMDTNKVSCLVNRHGFFTDYESNLKLIVNPNKLKTMTLILNQSTVEVNSSAQSLPWLTILKISK